MIRNVLKPDGTAHIEQQVGNMRYDLTTRQVDTVVPGQAPRTSSSAPTAARTSSSRPAAFARIWAGPVSMRSCRFRNRTYAYTHTYAVAHAHTRTMEHMHVGISTHMHIAAQSAHRAPAPVGALFFQSFSVPVFKPLHTGNNHLRGNGQRRGRARTEIFRKERRTEMRIPARALKPLAAMAIAAASFGCIAPAAYAENATAAVISDDGDHVVVDVDLNGSAPVGDATEQADMKSSQGESVSDAEPDEALKAFEALMTANDIIIRSAFYYILLPSLFAMALPLLLYELLELHDRRRL